MLCKSYFDAQLLFDENWFWKCFVFMRRYFDCLLMAVFDVLADGSV